MIAMQGDRLVIANEIAELRRMAQWLHECAGQAEIQKDLVFLLDVCANEAVSNIISYAYAGEQPHQIILELSRTEKGARLVIRDDGRPFNPLEVPVHVQPLRIQDAKVGGLGIHLIRRLMSHCGYQRVDGCNVLTFEAQGVLVPGDA